MTKLKIRYYNDQTDIRFPCTEQTLQEALAEIGAEQVQPLELYVTEVVFPEELGFLQDRFVNLDEVNYLAKRMDSFFGDEEYQFYIKGFTYQEIADKLGISKNGVRWNLDDMVEKGGFESREALVATAIENKLMVTTLKDE